MTEQLTREQVLSMPAGRELDLLVRTKVFGHDMTGFEWPKHGLGYSMVKETKTEVIWQEVKRCSTDISAAWEVLRQTKMIVHIEGHFHTGWAVTLDNKFTAIEWELPVAICKAALLAVMGL